MPSLIKTCNSNYLKKACTFPPELKRNMLAIFKKRVGHLGRTCFIILTQTCFPDISTRGAFVNLTADGPNSLVPLVCTAPQKPAERYRACSRGGWSKVFVSFGVPHSCTRCARRCILRGAVCDRMGGRVLGGRPKRASC